MTRETIRARALEGYEKEVQAMAIIEHRSYVPLVDDDPDDYRPNSSIALVLDPVRSDGKFVNGLTVLFERVAPGDRVPRHAHTIEEVVFIDAGTAEVVLGEERRTVGPGAVVFVPSGTPHQLRNVGPDPLHLHAVFPARTIPIQYLDRNPAPGTEEAEPQPPLDLDARQWVESHISTG
jgi:mannose-6-phosphate isomerase-like protein (cupin superfamily)